MSAQYIEFSGGDGSGKTTALTYFCDQLEARGFKVLRTREVGSPHIPACVKLRETILDPNQQLDGKTMEFVFAAMRVENQKFYKSVEDQYDFIVSDRGWLCHLAYTDHNESPEFTDLLYGVVMTQLTRLPDRVFLFNVDPEVSLGRRTRRGQAVDAIEAKGPEFQRKVLGSYMEHADRLASYTDTEVTVVDANQSLDQVKAFLDAQVEAYAALRA